MLGINYESSDDEEIVNQPQKPAVKAASPPKPTLVPVVEPLAQTNTVGGLQQGPALGPSAPPLPESPLKQDVTPQSPYTRDRARIQNLTLPTVANFDIPPSPPGSPPQRATKKFAQFLELKKKGQHFNQRLENSTVLRDPNHLQRLMDFAEITEQEQYASALPEDVAVPTEFPEWAYFEQLNESRKRILKSKEAEKARGQREAIDFVRATGSAALSGTGTSSVKISSKQITTERIMEILDGQQSDRSYPGNPEKRKEYEHRERSGYSSRSRHRSRSRSPGWKRSRSRDRRR
ncbi:hypothetical protein CC78DRAFT_615176 [Lojkania enalia]|uniref:Uncharacterized protein n=1 Tax=Lojkania enalia TaxID=147567 RepID=A0A9P4N4Z6_9PLEO|nr:hypothetical protein CC78DRAFT_615176 [Didymosphaeria enalia]